MMNKRDFARLVKRLGGRDFTRLVKRLGGVAKTAKKIGQTESTIRRWKKEGIPRPKQVVLRKQIQEQLLADWGASFSKRLRADGWIEIREGLFERSHDGLGNVTSDEDQADLA